jgi:signal transduction histidine kinase
MNPVREPPGRSTLLPRSAWLFVIACGLVGIGLAVGYGTSLANSLGPGVVFLPLVLVFASVGALIAARRPENAIGWLFLATALCWSIGVLAFGYATRAAAVGQTGSRIAIFADWLQTWLYIGGIGLALGPLFLLFPNGRPISRRWAPLVWVAFLAVIAICFAAAFSPSTFDPGNGDTAFLTQNPYALAGRDSLLSLLGSLGGAAELAVIIGGIASLIVRLRRAHGDERAQIRWLVYAALMVIVLGLGVQTIITNVFHRDPWSDPVIIFTLVALFGSIVFIPIAAGIGILKYHLYDIDVVIKKTVVLTVVTVALTVLYLGVIALATAGVVSRLAVGAILLVVTFRPVRRAARSLADRLVYGRRATAYEVLAAFSDRMVETYSTDDVLPRMSQILREATGATTAVVWLKVGRSLRAAASAGGTASLADVDLHAEAFPNVPGSFAAEVRHQGELLGALSVTMPANDELDTGREQVVRDLASQAGLVLRNVRLNEELKASRQRLVSAQDEERRRLERNIHDGAQQQLVALSVKLRLLEQLTERDVGRFDSTRTSYGTGLQGMADRLAALGGELTVQSAPDAGTTIEGRLPIVRTS